MARSGAQNPEHEELQWWWELPFLAEPQHGSRWRVGSEEGENEKVGLKHGH